MNESKRRNLEIEFYRFVFCIAVLLFHGCKYFLGEPSLGKPYHLTLFVHGSTGVEFFFVCSGFLFARSIKKSLTSNNKDDTDTIKFIYRKWMSFFPEHLCTYIVTVISVFLVARYSISKCILYLLRSVPSFLLIDMIGIDTASPNHVEWYISVMLIIMFIIYPIAKKQYRLFVTYIAPICGFLIMGYLQKNFASITGVKVWLGFCYKSMLRGLMEICLGMFSFELIDTYIHDFIHRHKILISIIHIFVLFAYISYMVINFTKKYEIATIFFSMFLMIVAYSGESFLHSLFNHPVWQYCGKATLSLYLSQCAAMNFTNLLFGDLSANYQIITYLFFTILLAIICVQVSKTIKAKIKRVI